VKRYEEVIDRTARRLGLQVSRVTSAHDRLPGDATPADAAVIAALRPYSMTSAERLWTLLNAVRYIVAEGVPGDVVECGVWRGGSMMAAAGELVRQGDTERALWLYDTYAGMTPPTDDDVEAGTGVTAAQMLASTSVGDGNNVWCVAGLADVEANMRSTGYPMDHISFVEGDVAQTLLTSAPSSIALLRLDTDWYESTKVGLGVLYPKLAVGGVCILDDYGHWEGARKAVDEYFAEHGPRPFMHPIDYSGRVFLKPASHG
jgi:O-methyltransferase